MANFGRAIFAFLAVFLALFINLVILEEVGPYKATVEEAGRCTDSGTDEFKFINPKIVRLDRNNRNFVTSLESTIVLDEAVDFYIDISIWGNGGWKENFFRLEEKNFVTWFPNTLPGLAGPLFKQSGLAGPPVPPGSYNYNISVNTLDVRNVAEVPHGRFNTQTSLVKDDHVIGCLRLLVDITANTKTRRQKKRKN